MSRHPVIRNLITPGKPRVRRDATFPARNFHFDPDERFLRKREVLGRYELAWGWSARRLLDGWPWEEDYPVRVRYLCGLISTDGVRVGAVELCEYQCGIGLSRRDFFSALFQNSAQTAELGRVICASFNEDEFAIMLDLGTILHWDSVWMHPDHAHGAIWARLTNQVIRRMRGWSILICKAFPLEYQDGGSAKGFQQRQQAMFRYYQRVLGVEPIQRRRSRIYGTPERGWMLRWHPGIVELDEDGNPTLHRSGWALTHIRDS